MADGGSSLHLHGHGSRSESDLSEGEIAARATQRRQQRAAAARRSQREAATRGRYLHLVDAPLFGEEFSFAESSSHVSDYTIPDQDTSILADPWHEKSKKINTQLGLDKLNVQNEPGGSGVPGRRARTLPVARAARSGMRVRRADYRGLTSFVESLDSWTPLRRFGSSVVVRRRRTGYPAAQAQAQAQAQQANPVLAQEEDEAPEQLVVAQGGTQVDIQEQIHQGLPDLPIVDYDSDFFFPDDE